AALGGVDQDGRVVTVGQVVGEMHAADPVVGNLHPVRQAGPGQAPGYLDPEPVVTEEDIPNASDQHPPGHLSAPLAGARPAALLDWGGRRGVPGGCPPGLALFGAGTPQLRCGVRPGACGVPMRPGTDRARLTSAPDWLSPGGGPAKRG